MWQKVVVWMIIWEMVGLGSGSMALTFRFMPPIGGILYWARPGTLRLPPWPDKDPAGAAAPRARSSTSRSTSASSGSDLAATCPASRRRASTPSRQPARAGSTRPAIAVTARALGAARPARQASRSCAARPEIYGLLLVVFLFPIENFIVASQIVLVCIWFGAATSKLNHHFASVVAVMVSNTPWQRSRAFKRKLWRNHPEDLRASRVANMAAHTGTIIEFGAAAAPAVHAAAGLIGQIAVIGMMIFHIHITSTFPLAVPLEWNLFMIFGILFLFGDYGAVPLDTLDDPLLAVILLVSRRGDADRSATCGRT